MNLRALVEVLEREREIIGGLLVLTGKEREAMKRYSLPELIECQKERKELNQRLRALGDRRQEIMAALSKVMRLPTETPTLSAVIERLGDGKEKSELEICRDALKRGVQELRIAHEVNRMVAESSSSFIDLSIRLLCGDEGAEPTTYMSSGEMKRHQKPKGMVALEV